jgi:hypothetical protein
METMLMAGKAFLEWTTGEDTRAVADFARDEAAREAPVLSWAEPEPRVVEGASPGRIQDFRALSSGAPQWPALISLLEARLFWKDKALHVVTCGDGCRWALLQELSNDGGGQPVQKDVYPVLTVKDRSRFGLDAVHVGGDVSLVAIEYRNDGRLFGWRLVPKP